MNEIGKNTLTLKRWLFSTSCGWSHCYHAMYNHVFEEQPDVFFYKSIAELEDAEIFALVDPIDGVKAALAAQRDTDGKLNFSSAFVPPKHRGNRLMAALVESSLHICFGRGEEEIIANIREFNDGTYNEASFVSFTKAGFKHQEDVFVKLQGNDADTHLLATANPEGFVKGRKLVARRTVWFG